MTRFEDFNQQSDIELIETIANDPLGPDGIVAKEILRFRRYKATSRLTFSSVTIAFSVAIFALIQLWITLSSSENNVAIYTENIILIQTTIEATETGTVAPSPSPQRFTPTPFHTASPTQEN